MFIKHKITGQIIDTDKPDDYIKSGSWAMLPDEKIGGVYGEFSKTQLMQMSGERRDLPKSEIVGQMAINREAVNVNFTDDLI